MEHALGLFTNLALHGVCTVALIALSISEVRETRRENRRRVEAIENQKIA